MGMFDTISISDPLPFTEEMKELGLDQNKYNWQTKDLHCSMSNYFIQGGELFEEKFETVNWVEGNPKAKSFSEKLGYLDRQKPYLEKVIFHGELYFCNIVDNVQDKWDCWLEFKATFSYGKVDKIELFKFKKTDNTQRKKLDKEFWEKINAESKIWYNKYFFSTKPVRKFKMFWYRFWSKVSELALKISFL